ncbi:MAG: hypothetical protein IBJ09_01370 [Bacteroidia bacterium]|nr:hypothetical protein [Bacteroidia bacterium]
MNQKNAFIAFGLSLALFSCSKEKKMTELKQKVVDNYAEVVHATYTDSYDQAVSFRTKVNAFVANPTDAGLNELKTFWAGPLRTSYGQSDAFRFYGGPIDDDNGKEGELNAWPLDEVYIDYVDGNATAGIINDPTTYPTLSKQLIIDLNEAGGETNISTGYHAIEFLLWGQDLYTNSAGLRPYTDYLTTGGTAANQARRGQYLSIVTDLLVEDLKYTADAWAGSASYRSTFSSQDPNTSLQLIFTGIGKFCKGELFGERFEVAYSTQSQEDEHSCFSDQTHNDLRFGILGIENVFYGRYTNIQGTQIDGPGIDELLEEADPELNKDVKAKLQAAKDAVYALHAPFDQEIVTADGRARCLTAIDAGNALADKIVEAASALGIQIVL